MRIHRTPDAEASGGGEPVAPPVAPKPAPVIPPDVTADLAELRALRADKAQREAEARVKADSDLREQKRFEELLKSREAELATSRAAQAEFEKRTKKSVLDRELALALSAQNLRPGAAKHLTKLLADELEVVPDSDGGYAVRSKDRRPVSDFIAETLKSPDYDSFVSSAARPGAPQGGGSRSADTPPPPQAPTPPKNLGEAIIGAFTEVRSNPDNSIASPRGFKAIR